MSGSNNAQGIKQQAAKLCPEKQRQTDTIPHEIQGCLPSQLCWLFWRFSEDLLTWEWCVFREKLPLPRLHSPAEGAQELWFSHQATLTALEKEEAEWLQMYICSQAR